MQPRPHAPCSLPGSVSPASSRLLRGLLLLWFWPLTTHFRMLEATVRRKSSERTPRPRPSACAGDGDRGRHQPCSAQGTCAGPPFRPDSPGAQLLPHCPALPTTFPCPASSPLRGSGAHTPRGPHPSCEPVLPTGPEADPGTPFPALSRAPRATGPGYPPCSVSSALHRRILPEAPCDSTRTLPTQEPLWTSLDVLASTAL